MIFASVLLSFAAACVHPSRALEEPVLEEDKSCFLDGGPIRPEVFADLAFGEHGLSWVLLPDSSAVFHVRPDGQYRRTVWYDNGADYFAQGLARVLVGGKMGYMDTSLTIRIEPRWDFASPFREDGRAAVCNGCTKHKDPDDEHSSMVGGEWWSIDTTGRVLESDTARGTR